MAILLSSKRLVLEVLINGIVVAALVLILFFFLILRGKK